MTNDTWNTPVIEELDVLTGTESSLGDDGFGGDDYTS